MTNLYQNIFFFYNNYFIFWFIYYTYYLTAQSINLYMNRYVFILITGEVKYLPLMIIHFEIIIINNKVGNRDSNLNWNFSFYQ